MHRAKNIVLSRSRTTLKNAALIAKICVDTAENEPRKSLKKCRLQTRLVTAERIVPSRDVPESAGPHAHATRRAPKPPDLGITMTPWFISRRLFVFCLLLKCVRDFLPSSLGAGIAGKHTLCAPMGETHRGVTSDKNNSSRRKTNRKTFLTGSNTPRKDQELLTAKNKLRFLR